MYLETDRLTIRSMELSDEKAYIDSWKVAEKAGFVLVETKMYQDYGDAVEKLYHFYEMTKKKFTR